MLRSLNLLFASNPLITYAFSKPRKYSHQQVAVATSFGIILSFSIGYALLTTYQFQILFAIWITMWVLYLGIPIVIAGSAALITANDMENGSFQLLYMTSLRDDVIIVGYIALILERFRTLIAVKISLMPIFVVSMFYMLIRFEYEVASNSRFFYPESPAREEVILPLLGFIVLIISIWFANILAAGIGVVTAIRYRNMTTASPIAISVMGGAMILMTIVAWSAFLIPQTIQLSLMLCSPAAFILFFSLLWDSMMRIGNDNVRQPSVD